MVIVGVYTLTVFNPRSVWCKERKVICETQVIIQNSGCKSCFEIATDKVFGRPDFLNSIPGCSLSYPSSKYTYNFRIDEPFNAHEILKEIWKKSEKFYCK